MPVSVVASVVAVVVVVGVAVGGGWRVVVVWLVVLGVDKEEASSERPKRGSGCWAGVVVKVANIDEVVVVVEAEVGSSNVRNG